MNMVTVTYLSPKGRRMARDLIGRSYAELLGEARKVARRPGVKNVKLWSQGGQLLTSLRPRNDHDPR